MTDLSIPLQTLDTWVADGAVRGAAAAVWHRGAIVARHAAGVARDDTPVTDDTLFALASVSKPATAAAVLAAVDAGDLTLDTPAALIVPEFGEVADPLDDDVLPQLEALRDRVTIRQLLSHTSGLPENIGVKRVRMRDLPTLEALTDAMCGLPLLSAPGEVLAYSNAGFGVLARAVARATGIPFHQYLQVQVLDPLGLADYVTRPGPEWDARIAHTDDSASAGTPAESYNSPYWRALGIPWGGYFATTADVVTFAASFFSGQSSPLSGDSREEMVVDQTGGVPGGVGSAGVHWNHGLWGLGWEVAGTKRNHWTGSLRSPRTFCHWGQSGTLVWADPDRELALAVFGNRTVHKPWPLKPPRWAELSDALVTAADQG
jgi:CubicO group peptidase (beta-lactamase class C family)